MAKRQRWLLVGGLLSVIFVVAPATTLFGAEVTNLRCEYREAPRGIDVAQPRLSWRLDAPERGRKQTAYQVLVASSLEKLAQEQGDLWDSGKVASDQSAHVPYAGRGLTSYQECFWKARVWDENGHPMAWSQPSSWTMGLLAPSDWKAKWIGYEKPFDHDTGWAQKAPSPVFRKTFEVEGPVRSATLSISGLGYFVARINGERVGDHVLDPGFTRYDRRVLYLTHDVTKLLKPGKNAIGVMLGNGFYNSHTIDVWDFHKAPWRDQPKVLAQLRLVMADGSEKMIATDETWKANTGPVVLDGIRNGQVYDARLEMPGWDTAAFDDSKWAAPQLVAAPAGKLHAQMQPPIKVTQSVEPASFKETSPGVWLFDLGQNLAGWARLKVRGPAGTKVDMLYGERVGPDGKIDRKIIGQHVKSGPFQTDTYILKGQGDEQFESLFAYHGFRWVEVHGLPSAPDKSTILGRVVHTAFEPIGSFACSNDLLNTIQRLTLWSYRSNFEGIPTDCPHREKNGWTGDAHLAAEQAMYNFENSAGYTKWLDDLADEQQPDGNLPGIVPTSGWGYKWGNGPAWDSAFVLIPWYLYQYRGDTRILANHYEGMKRYVDYMTSRADAHGLVSHGLGDWVPAKTETPVIVTSSGYYFVDATIVAKVAELLGKTEDARKYAELANHIRSAFNQQLGKSDGVYANGSQTAQSCAIQQGLAPSDLRGEVIARLVEAVHKADDHLDTGILGAKYLFRALSENGQHDLAYKIACQKTAPSYGDWVQRGATTLWEDWKDGDSRNHIMFGDISAWFYRELAGIQVDPAHPGMRHIVIRPRPVADLKWVRAKTESMDGVISSEWHSDGTRLTLKVTVPPNASATVYVPLPTGLSTVTEGGKRPQDAVGVRPLGPAQNGYAPFEITSGTYEFAAQ